MNIKAGVVLLVGALLLGGCAATSTKDLKACATMTTAGFRPAASERDRRFDGKVLEDTAQCRGGDSTTRSPPGSSRRLRQEQGEGDVGADQRLTPRDRQIHMQTVVHAGAMPVDRRRDRALGDVVPLGS